MRARTRPRTTTAACAGTRGELIDLGPRYEHIREVGSGGMGRVFLVRDRHLEKELALKLLHEKPAEPGELERVRNEFAILAKIEHPGIARAYDFGFLGALPYYTREFVRGESLRDRNRIEDSSELLRLARRIAEPLAYLHSARVLHLDLKPSNVILPVGAEPDAVLIDFGLFRWDPPGNG